jgi:hypothetical protein
VAAALYNNRALARLKLQQWLAAPPAAAAAASLRPEWHKPCFRLAQAQCELGSFKLAIATCRTGERLLEKVRRACSRRAPSDRGAAQQRLERRVRWGEVTAGGLRGWGKCVGLRFSAKDPLYSPGKGLHHQRSSSL